jgi:hypothetical protein
MKRDHPNAVKTRWSARVAGVAGGLALLPGAASAAIFHGETLDKVADVMAIIVLIVVPITVIVLFWLVHVLPEKIAHKRHHPQLEAIKTLCLLSLVFGGLLWPLAWIWAYSKPVLYKMAYGTDKHPEYFATGPQGEAEAEAPAPAQGASASERDLQRLRVAISDLRSSEDPAALHALRAELLSLERQLADREAIAVARTRKAEVA